jgi:AcrR family transcriptional regulator
MTKVSNSMPVLPLRCQNVLLVGILLLALVTVESGGLFLKRVVEGGRRPMSSREQERSIRLCYYLSMRSENRPGGQQSGSFIELARRKQIIDGAVAVLAQNGYAATSLAAIGEHLGMSKGLISYHFSGKAELLNEVVRSVLEHAESWMSPQIAAAASFTEALRLYISSNLAFLDTYRTEIFALTEVLANARAIPGVSETFGQTQRAAVAGLAELFTAGQKAGEFGSFSARIAALSLRASIDGATTALRDDPDFDPSGFAAELTTLFERLSARRPAEEASDGNG